MLRVLVRWLSVAACVASAAAMGACGDEGSGGGTLVPDAGVGGGDGAGATGGGGSSGAAGADGSGGCASTADCPSGQVCDRTASTCVQCVIDGDCATGSRCVNNTCQRATCQNSLDCVGGQNLVCDLATGACVQCLVPNDCPDNHDCTDHVCVPYIPCSDTQPCQGGLICDPSVSRCVQCLDSTHCGDQRKCVGNICRPDCTSNEQCASLGLLCSTNNGYCVECLRDDECTESRHCSLGACKADICTPGSQRCELDYQDTSDALFTCNAAGSGWGTPSLCSFTQTCKATTTGASCQNHVCTPATSQCDATTERVMQCSADGLAQAVKEDCGSQVCVAATCRPVVCAAGTRACDMANNSVMACSAKGDAINLYDQCTTAEYCDDTTKTCITKVCTPDAPTCNGSFATVCNSIGSAPLAGGTNCSITSQYCVQGQCRDQICMPNATFCENGNVRLCAADGLSSTPYQTCTTTQYCSEGTGSASCQAKVCTPNAPACNGNSVSTCNALGSGYVSAGTPCGTQYCVSGTCQNALFAENFEDGDFYGWTSGTASYTRTVTSATAANGSTYSMLLTRIAAAGTYDGIYRTFSALQPTNISWYARVPTSTSTTYFYAPYVVLLPTTGTTSALATTYVYKQGTAASGTLYLSVPSGCASSTSVSSDTWFQVELRNINWTTRTFDYYVNGLVRGSSCIFGGTYSSISRMDVYVNTANGSAQVDEILFQ